MLKHAFNVREINIIYRLFKYFEFLKDIRRILPFILDFDFVSKYLISSEINN
jgi:hypothetical protein